MKVQQLEGLSWMWNTSPITMVWFQSFMDFFQQFGLVFVPQSMEWKIAHFPCKMQFQWLLEKVLKLPSIDGMEDCSCLVLICFNVKVWFLLWLLFNRKLFCLVLFEFIFLFYSLYIVIDLDEGIVFYLKKKPCPVHVGQQGHWDNVNWGGGGMKLTNFSISFWLLDLALFLIIGHYYLFKLATLWACRSLQVLSPTF